MRNEVLKGATHEGVLRLVTPRGGLDLLVEWIHGEKLTNVYQLLCLPLTYGLGTEYICMGKKWMKRRSKQQSQPSIL